MTGNENNQTQAYGVDIWNPNHTSDQCIKSETLQSLFAVLRHSLQKQSIMIH